MRFSSKPAFNAVIPRSSEVLVATGGGVIALLLFAIALSLSATRERAMACHRSQRSPYDDLSPQLRRAFLSTDYVVATRRPD